MPKGARSARNKYAKNANQQVQFKEIDQEYAIVTKALGDCRLQCRLPNGETKIAHIRGAMRNKAKSRVITGDMILISEREFESGKVDVIDLYSKDDIRTLKKLGEIDESFISGKKGDDEIEFAELPEIEDEEDDS